MADEAPQSPQVDIYDISQDKPVLGTIAPEEVEPAISSGNYSFPKEARVPVINPDGQQGDIAAEDAPQAFQQGYKYATPGLVDEAKYGTTGQQVITGIEGALQGAAGLFATAAEVGLGVDPKDIRKRAETNPLTHGFTEAAGFVAPALLSGGMSAEARGVMEAATLPGIAGKIGSAAVEHLGVDAAGIGSRIANGAIRAGAEMAAIQSSDEMTKAITQDPNQSIGSAVADIGLSGLLGSATGGVLSGLGGLVSKGLEGVGDSQVLNDFKNRIGARASGVSQSEAIGSEIKNSLDFFHSTGNEISGADGLTSQSLQKVLPESMTPEIASSVFETTNKALEAINDMKKEGVPDRLIKKYQNKLNDFMSVASDANATPAEHFDALNEFKRDLAGFSKGAFGQGAVPAHSEAYDFLNITKNLGHDIRLGLENPEIWGKDAAGIQKEINAAWVAAIKPAKQVEQKFMAQVGNDRVMNAKALDGYLKEGEKATSPSIRQQIMGKYADAMEQFHGAISSIYEKNGIQAPDIPGMGAIRESLNKPTLGTKLADAWTDKLGARAGGNALGIAVGTAISPGLGGAYVGREVLGPAFGAMLQPILEKSANSSAFKQSIKFGGSIIDGVKNLTKASKGIFNGSALPVMLIPKEEELHKLDKQLKDLHSNQNKMLNVSGDIGHYAPDHATALAATAMNAVNLANQERPGNQKQSPLDADLPITQQQKSEWNRTLSIAQQPLMVMQHIKDGTLQASDISTVTALYPDFYNKMTQEVMHSMTDHISKGETIPYKMRQSLSLFLGQPLDSVLAPMNIMASQGVFAQLGAQQQQPAPKKNTGKMDKMAGQYRTNEQAAQERQTKA